MVAEYEGFEPIEATFNNLPSQQEGTLDLSDNTLNKDCRATELGWGLSAHRLQISALLSDGTNSFTNKIRLSRTGYTNFCPWESNPDVQPDCGTRKFGEG